MVAAVGAVACMLLTLRQARLEAANELAESRLRIQRLDRRLSMVRADIASRVVPDSVRDLTGDVPLGFEPIATTAPDDDEAAETRLAGETR